MRFKTLLALFICVALFNPLVSWSQDEATISGKITDESGDPLPGANVFVQLTNLGAATDVNGEYKFTVPASAVSGQEVTLEARFIGYRHKTQKINLTPGSHTMDFALAIDVLDMDAIVVTGVVDETPRVKMAFAVGRVSQAQLEKVPAISAESALRGKIAGVKIVQGSGEPGAAASIQLRAPTSINAAGRSQDPLYIIDGVIIDPSISGSPLADIPSDDIASIEVVKGAAGASLYGSRAANGVINITTRRGNNLALNQTRIRFRNEFGISQLENKLDLANHHFFKISDSDYTDTNGIRVTPGDFIDSDGNFADPRQPGARTPERYTDGDQGSGIFFQDKAYKWVGTGDIVLDDLGLPVLDAGTGQPAGLQQLPGGTIFDHMDRFFDPGTFVTNSVSISRNMENSNFSVSLGNTVQDGVIQGLNGFTRRHVRFSLDHKFRKDVTISLSAFYSASERDDIGSGSGSPFFGLTFMGGDTDLGATHNIESGTTTFEFPDGIPSDVVGELFIQPDANADRDNPLYAVQRNDRTNDRTRAMGSLSLSYRPVDWFKAEGNFSYDRSNRENNLFFPIGFQTISAGIINDGRFQKFPSFDEALNGNITVSFQKALADQKLTVRAKVRTLFERTEFQNTFVRGSDLAVRGVRDLSIADPEDIVINSRLEQVRSEGYSFIAGIDYLDRYIADFLVRRDGSSLFGPDERWHNYFRVSGAYRLSQEPWWFTDKINEFKLRASFGTAGGRPNFFSRFETWSVTAGVPSKVTLGNKELKPEFAKELEIGLDMVFLDRFSLELTRAESTVEDQLLNVPLVAYFGFASQWQNAGTLETETWEASLQGALIQKSDMSLSFGINFDKTTQDITALNRPAYTFAPASTDLEVFRIEAGEEFGALYGGEFMANVDDILTHGLSQDQLNQFQVNDDDYLVWVGAGSSYRDGISQELWGTTTSLFSGFDAGGDSTFQSYEWGLPIFFQDEGGQKANRKIGSIVPDFNLSFSTDFQWKNFSLYGLLDAQIGGDIYSMTGQWGFSEFTIGENDQFGKEEGLKKPTKYYSILYDTRNPTSHFIDSGEYLKIRELSLRYTFNRNQLGGLFGGVLNKVTFGVVGRNLLTFTGFKGYDPEVGESGGQGGSAALSRFDGFSYPNFRSFTGVFEVEF